MNEEIDPDTRTGFVEPSVQAEFPGLRLDWTVLAARARPSPRAVAQRVRALSDRYRGANVVSMRTQPVPHAYRSFFHHVGLDPDTTRIPSEQAAVARLLQGRFDSRDVLRDALLIALVETGVPVWALDADLVDAGGLGIRATVPGDRLGLTEESVPLSPGRLVVADARAVHAALFGAVAPGHEASPRTTRVALFAVGVEGVPAIHIDEALWLCAETLRSA